MQIKRLFLLILMLSSGSHAAGAETYSFVLAYDLDLTHTQFRESDAANILIPTIAYEEQFSDERMLSHGLLVEWRHAYLQSGRLKMEGAASARWAMRGRYDYVVGNKEGRAKLTGGLQLGYAGQAVWQFNSKISAGMLASMKYMRMGGAATGTSIYPYQAYNSEFTVQALYPALGLFGRYRLPAPFAIEAGWDLAFFSLWQDADYTILSVEPEANGFSQQQLRIGIVYQF